MTSVLLTVKGYYLLHYSCSFSQTETKVFSLSTTGEANVYTLGDIGHHRVVSTKLPMTGSSGSALIATGSTTTRLLGTFQVRLRVFKMLHWIFLTFILIGCRACLLGGRGRCCSSLHWLWEARSIRGRCHGHASYWTRTTIHLPILPIGQRKI